MTDLERYTETGISEIQKADILGQDDIEKIRAISNELEDTWRKQHVFRTELEMRTSVLNDTSFPTKAHKYLQARREQDVHFRELIFLSCDYQEKQGELLQLQGELEELQRGKDEGKIRQGKIMQKEAQIKRAKFSLAEMRKVAHHRVREVTTWERIKKDLLDGSFDPDDVDKIQAEGYNIRWQRELQSELQSQNPDGHRIGTLRGELSSLYHEYYDKDARHETRDTR